MFITFEGMEGSGKTTQIQKLKNVLVARGFTVVCTREPGGCPIADKIRGILLDPESKGITNTAELLLFAAARHQHLNDVVRPALAAGHVVLCDRFTDSTIAYQGNARGVDPKLIEKTIAIATGGLKPDLTLVFDLPVEVGLGRVLSRILSASIGENEGRFDSELYDFHAKVKQGFLLLAKEDPDRVTVVDADRDPLLITDSVKKIVLSRLTGGSF